MQVKSMLKKGVVKGALFFGITLLFLIASLGSAYSREPESKDEIINSIQLFRKERDHFFKTASNSPLEESDQGNFKGLHYYPIDLKYRFEGTIQRYIINVNNPKYYATF